MNDTDWASIVWLYDKLADVAPSPVVSLNRAIALAELFGPTRGLNEVRIIEDKERLSTYPFYHAALGEFELRLGNHSCACEHFHTAVGLARNSAERRFLQQRGEAADAAAT